MSKNNSFIGIRWKLLLPELGALFVLFILMQAVWLPWELSNTRSEIHEEQRLKLQSLAPALIEPLLAQNLGQLYSTLDSVVTADEGWHRLELQDVNGTRLFPLGDEPDLKDGQMTVSHAIHHDGSKRGELILRYDAQARIDAEAGQIQLVGIVILVAFLSMLLLNFVWQDFLILRPARKLAEAANLLAQGDFDVPIEVNGNDEIARLGDAFNRMRTDLRSITGNLRDQGQRTQAILDNMVDGLITIDRRGIIDSFNPAAERIFGYTAEEALGKNVNILMPSPHRENHDEYLRNYHATGIARIIGIGREVEGQRKHGSLFPMDLSISEVSRDGESMYVGMVRDITERKHAERMKSEFVSTVSHELRTPLTAISGSLGLIMGGAFGDVPEKAKEMIGIAHKNGQRLSHLINDLLDIEKLAAGKMHFDMQRLALMPLIEQALEVNRTYGSERGVQMILAGEAVEADVKVDTQRLMQVLSNLLSNAVKYSPDGGTVEVSVQLRDEAIRVTVSDHGQGIPQEFRARIFQKFAQADSSDTRKKGGTGLGLAITRELVEGMGGRVDFESVEGRGASFFFELPLVSESGSLAAMQPLQTSDPGGRKILVVEDEPDVARLLGLMLQRAGYVVDIVMRGAQALEALKRTHYAAMTLDLMLPDISGLQIIREVRGNPETADLPIVVVSAKLEEGRLAINGDASGIDWLAKPFDEKKLLELVERQLSLPGGEALHVLHIEDDPDLHNVIKAMLGGRCSVEAAITLADARARVALQRFDVVILDIGLPDGSGWDLLPEIREHQPDARVVILSGGDMKKDEASLVEAVLLKSRVSSEQLLDAISDGKHLKLTETAHERVATHSVRRG